MHCLSALPTADPPTATVFDCQHITRLAQALKVETLLSEYWKAFLAEVVDLLPNQAIVELLLLNFVSQLLHCAFILLHI